MKKIAITGFAERHFDPKFGGTKILDYTPEEFETIINEEFEKLRPYGYETPEEALGNPDVFLRPGYADFCKILFVRNFTRAKTGTMKLEPANYLYLRSDYSARRKGELAVMSRWLEIPRQFVPEAEWLAVVLYDKNQIDKEGRETVPFNSDEIYVSLDAEWGIVAILAQMTNFEEPMKPETMIRNSMDIKYGGSGVALDEEAYKRSVDFWTNYATVK